MKYIKYSFILSALLCFGAALNAQEQQEAVADTTTNQMPEIPALLPPAVKNYQFGLGLKLGYQPKSTGLEELENDVRQIWTIVSSSNDTSQYSGGFDIFYERYIDKDSLLGVRLGADFPSTDKLEFKRRIGPPGPIIYRNYKIQLSSVLVPLSLYYKHELGKKFNLYGGAGVTMMLATLKDADDKYHANKAFTHALFGAEWRVSETMGLSADFKYNFSAKVNSFEDFDMKYDLSGLSTALMLRLYIF